MSFGDDASLFPHQLDVVADRVLVVKLTEDDYRSASFLDGRLLNQTFPMEWFDWDQLLATLPGNGSNVRWIYHIGHVGSTLISRLLGDASNVLALREPQILRQLAELKRIDGKPLSPWPPGRFSARLESVAAWFGRNFKPSQIPVVKASSFANEIASDLAALGGRAVLLYVSPERYIKTILAGENSRQELAALVGPRLERLNSRLQADPINLWELDEAKKAAVAWACEMTTLAELDNPAECWFDFDHVLNNPIDGLLNIANSLEIALDPDEADALISSPIMRQYSKAPEHGYSVELREQLLRQTEIERGAEIAGALRWLEDIAGHNAKVADAINLGTRA